MCPLLAASGSLLMFFCTETRREKAQIIRTKRGKERAQKGPCCTHNTKIYYLHAALVHKSIIEHLHLIHGAVFSFAAALPTEFRPCIRTKLRGSFAIFLPLLFQKRIFKRLLLFGVVLFYILSLPKGLCCWRGERRLISHTTPLVKSSTHSRLRFSGYIQKFAHLRCFDFETPSDEARFFIRIRKCAILSLMRTLKTSILHTLNGIKSVLKLNVI